MDETFNDNLKGYRAPHNIIDILEIYSIFDSVCEQLDLGSLVSLRRLSRRLAHNLQVHSKKRWDVDQQLRRFVDNPIALRATMRRYNTLISGSFPVQFIGHHRWCESDLDFFVHRDNAALFEQYLIDQEGYSRRDKVVIEPPYSQYDLEGLWSVKAYVRMRHGRQKRVEVIATRYKPVKFILEEFHSTVVLNIMTYAACYSLFPRWTFCEPLKLCSTMRTNEPLPTAVQKYRDRGWKFINDIEEACVHLQTFVEARFIGDEHTLTMRFNTEGVCPQIERCPADKIGGIRFRTYGTTLLPVSDYGETLVNSCVMACF